MFRHACCALALAVTVAVPAWAAAEDESDEAKPGKETPLEEVVVTATRTEQELFRAPGSVSVITRDSLDKRNIQSLDGALKEVPGFYSRREAEFSLLQPVISMRGIAGQNRTLVMIDDIPLNEPRTGAGYFDGISVGDVQKIEVVKGPFSSLYGGYAMAGVINVMTKMPEKQEFVFKGGYGTSWNRNDAYDDLTNLYASYGDRFFDRWSVFASYGRSGTNGFPYQWNVTSSKPAAGVTGYSYTTDNAGNPRYLIGNKGDGFSWTDDVTVKTQYEVSDATTVGFTFLRTNYRNLYDPPNTLLTNAAGASVFTDGTSKILAASYLPTASGRTRDIYNMKLDTELGPIKTKLSWGLVDEELSYNRTPGTTAATTQFGGPGTYLNSPAQEWFVDLQFTAPEVFKQVFTWGGAFRNDSTNSTTYNLSNWLDSSSKTSLASDAGGTSNTFALFLQDEIKIREDLTAFLGGRMDWWQVYDGYNQSGTLPGRADSAFSPKAALVYQPFAKTTLRASGGKSFRAPSLYELYSNYVGSYTLNPNPNLTPETAWSWDAGVDQGLWTGAKAKVTYFQNYLSNLIYTQTLSPILQTRVNVGKAKRSGVEMEIEQRVAKWVRLFGDATFTDAYISDDPANPAIVGRRMVDIPKWLLNVGVEAEYGPVSGSVVGRYVTKRFSTDLNTDTVNQVYTSYDPFFTVDAKISYHFLKYFTLSFAVNNLLNANYFVYYQAPGRSWYTELAARF